MKKASFLTRLRFSYTYALLESAIGLLRQSGRTREKPSSLKVNIAHPAR